MKKTMTLTRPALSTSIPEDKNRRVSIIYPDARLNMNVFFREDNQIEMELDFILVKSTGDLNIDFTLFDTIYAPSINRMLQHVVGVTLADMVQEKLSWCGITPGRERQVPGSYFTENIVSCINDMDVYTMRNNNDTEWICITTHVAEHTGWFDEMSIVARKERDLLITRPERTVLDITRIWGRDEEFDEYKDIIVAVLDQCNMNGLVYSNSVGAVNYAGFNVTTLRYNIPVNTTIVDLCPVINQLNETLNKVCSYHAK